MWKWFCCCLSARNVCAQVYACYTVYDHQNDTERKWQSCATAHSADNPWSFDTGDSSTHTHKHTLGLWYISISVASPSLLSFWIIFFIQYPLLVNAMLHSRLCLCEKQFSSFEESSENCWDAENQFTMEHSQVCVNEWLISVWWHWPKITLVWPFF